MSERAYFRCIAEWLDCRQGRADGAEGVLPQIGELDWMAEAWRILRERGGGER